MPKLTTHLLAHAPEAFTSATQHPWLHLAGTNALSRPSLLAWLTQDRLYALNYPTFIGSLLSKVHLSSAARRIETLEWRICSLLIESLTNIRRELQMFEDVLKEEFDWQEGGEVARQETRAYADVFAGATRSAAGLLEGMVVLWATEKCYLEAWKFARDQVSKDDSGEDVLRKTLIPNWTCAEFEEFVDTIGGLVDELGVNASMEEWGKAEDAWRQVLWAEEKFWPEV
jgi:thiaminase